MLLLSRAVPPATILNGMSTPPPVALVRAARHIRASTTSLRRLVRNAGYQLSKPWFDGRTEIVLDPIAFLRRLAALIPAPYTNLVRYQPGACDRGYRSQPGACDRGQEKSERQHCSRVFARAFPASVAGSRLAVHLVAVNTVGSAPPAVSGHTDPGVLTRILDHLKLPSSPPRLAPARSRIDEQDLFAEEETAESVYREDPSQDDSMPTARAPP